MENNEIKIVRIKICTWYYFNCMIKLKDFGFDNILVDEKSHENILIYDSSYKNVVGKLTPWTKEFDTYRTA